jgi:hypothetical protein
MQFIANGLNGNYLRSILPPSGVEIDGVMAAIAYGSNFNDQKNDFIGHCLANRYRLDIWMRYDHTVPVATTLLKRLLKHHKDNIFCYLVPDCLHSKVIWWKGYGAYIGSANLTDRAWVSNIEAGVFLSESDLQNDNLQIELESFFEGLRSAKQVFPLTEEIIRELEKMELERRGVDEKGQSHRSVPIWEGPMFFEAKKTKDFRKEAFRREWQETLTHLRSIGNQLNDNRPSWITDEVPIGWQIDQFLHAYYYNKVGDSREKPYEDYFRNNKANPNQALVPILKWWKETTVAPSHEDETFYKSAPLIRKYLASENILSLNEQQFSEICARTHATKDHVSKIRLSTLGRNDVTTMSQEGRLPLYAEWLLRQRNRKEWNVLKLLHYVLYEGQDDVIWERLYTATREPDYSLPHYGLNSIAELIGWARPEVVPPRNGRTSKALRALGYDVRVY